MAFQVRGGDESGLGQQVDTQPSKLRIAVMKVPLKRKCVLVAPLSPRVLARDFVAVADQLRALIYLLIL